MKKICEIDAISICTAENVHAWQERIINRIPTRQYRRSRKLSDEFVEAAFTPAQQEFLDIVHWTARPHPKHSPCIEIFVDEKQLTPEEKTWAALLFSG